MTQNVATSQKTHSMELHSSSTPCSQHTWILQVDIARSASRLQQTCPASNHSTEGLSHDRVRRDASTRSDAGSVMQSYRSWESKLQLDGLFSRQRPLFQAQYRLPARVLLGVQESSSGHHFFSFSTCAPFTHAYLSQRHLVSLDRAAVAGAIACFCLSKHAVCFPV